jgi:hypothetical protein
MAESQGEYMGNNGENKRKIKIVWHGAGKIDEEFTEMEKITTGVTALLFKVPKSFSSSPARIKSNMDFLNQLQGQLQNATGRVVPCFLIPEEVTVEQVTVIDSETDRWLTRIRKEWAAFKSFFLKRKIKNAVRGDRFTSE